MPRKQMLESISRRDTLELIGKTSLVALLAAACRTTPPPPPVTDIERPNILYIHSHDTGRYIEPYGYSISTPNLQAFADEGMVFRQIFAASPTCSPSRASFMTGMTPGCNGMWGLAHLKNSHNTLNDYRQGLVPFFNNLGYKTVLAGVQHIYANANPVVAGKHVGYSEVLSPKGSLATAHVDAATEFLNGPISGPFFLDVGFKETHVADPPDWKPSGARFFHDGGDPGTATIPDTLTDTPETRQDMGDFEVAASQMDADIGQLLETLDKRGLKDNTLVIITTDHGIPLPGLKANHTDGGLGITLMLRGPGGFTGGKVSNALVSNIDVFPTLCEVLKQPIPSWIQGKSLMPLVRGETDEINDAVFAEYESHAAVDPMASVRTHDYKYVRRLAGATELVQLNTDGTRTKELWLRDGWDMHLLEPEQLYDLKSDPLERINLAANPDYAAVLSDMRGRMVARMEQYDNPLLRKYNVVNAPREKMMMPQGMLPTIPGASQYGELYTGD